MSTTHARNESARDVESSPVTVEYTANTQLADEPAFVEFVRAKITRHLKSVDFSSAENLRVVVQEFEFTGKVRMRLTGTIHGNSVDEVFIHVDKRPKLSSRTYRSVQKNVDWRQRNGLALLCVWLIAELIGGTFRLLFPSAVARAVGRRFVSGRVLRSLGKCISDVQTSLNKAIDRSSTGLPLG